jgi:RNase H-fold protein (predicted Holliday junction resolvase)
VLSFDAIEMPRTMGLDWGERRIGVAVSDELRLTSQGVAVVQVRKDGAERAELKKLIAEWLVDRVIVGVPIRDDGTPGPTAWDRLLRHLDLHGGLAPGSGDGRHALRDRAAA